MSPPRHDSYPSLPPCATHGEQLAALEVEVSHLRRGHDAMSTTLEQLRDIPGQIAHLGTQLDALGGQPRRTLEAASVWVGIAAAVIATLAIVRGELRASPAPTVEQIQQVAVQAATQAAQDTAARIGLRAKP